MNKKIGILLSISLLATAATTATIAAIAAKGKFKKQQELKQNIEKSKAELNKAKSILEKLLNSDYAKNVNKLEESKILDNAKIDENSSLQDIKNKTKQVKEAINSLTQKILERKQKEQQNQNDKKTLDKLRLDFANAQEELKALINSKDGKSVDTTKAAEVLKNTKITNSSAAFQVLQAVQTIKKATKELQEAIKFKKQQEFNEFNKIKQELTDYIANDLNDLKYKDIKAKAEKSIEKVSDININSSFISDIQQATKLLIDAKKQAISEVEKINKSSELEKYNTTKTSLEQLIKTDDAKEVDTTEATVALTKNSADKNSTLEEITKATKALEDAKSKLDQEIKAKKEAEFNNLTNAKTELSNLITKQAPAEAISKAKKVLEEINGLNLSNDSSIKSLKDATQKINAANEALKQAIEKLEAEKTEKLQKFNEAKKALEDLIKEEDAIQTGVEAAKKVLEDNNANENSTLDEITKATKALEDAKSKLDQEIKAKKEAEFNNLTNAKTELSNLITKQAPAEAISKAKKVLEEINGLNLSNDSSIKSLKDATQKIKDAETQLTKEIEKLKAEKTEKLQKFNEAKKALEDLIKEEDAKEVGTSNAEDALKTNVVDKNSTLDEITNVTKALEDAKSKLDQEIKAKKQELMANLKEKNEKLEALLNTENLDDLMSIEKLIGLSAGEIKNKLEDAKKLLQEAKGLPENSKITNINQKIQKIDEYVRQFGP